MNEGTAPKGLVDRLLALNAWIVYIFFYAPIVVLIVFSFNENDNVAIWTQPSLRWYGEMFQNDDVMGALRNSLIVAFVLHDRLHGDGDDAGDRPGALPIPGSGNTRRAGLSPDHHPRRDHGGHAARLLLPGLRHLEYMFGINLTTGLPTITLAHIAFSISFVAIVVRARLSQLDNSLEEAAADLYASRWQAFRKVTLPLIATRRGRRGAARIDPLARRRGGHPIRIGVGCDDPPGLRLRPGQTGCHSADQRREHRDAGGVHGAGRHLARVPTRGRGAWAKTG